jgi:type VI secretion system secreted protein VgrG
VLKPHLGKSGADSDFGSGTHQAVMDFQRNFVPTNEMHSEYDLKEPDGIVGSQTLLALGEAISIQWSKPKQPHPFIDSETLTFLYKNVSVGLTEQDYKKAAADLDCEIEAIKAVAITETGNSGSFYDFYEDLVPSILFERHYFSRLTGGLYDETHPEISNRVTGGYGKFSAQYNKLVIAHSLDSSAALKSASWGRFQIMGANHKLCNYETVEEFVYDLSLSENNHLRCFVEFIKNNHQLHKAIKEKDWLTFALKYNGPQQKGYDIKMKENYEKISN